MVASVTAFGFAAGRVVRTENLDVLYLLVVFVSALEWGRGPAIFAALVSAAVFDFCFVPPRFTFGSTDLPYVVSLGVFVAVGVVTSEIAARAREASLVKVAKAEARAKDVLLNRIAHELRSPLTAILGRVQLLKKVAADSPAVQRQVPALEHSAAVLSHLIEDLLDASRAKTGKLRVHVAPVQLAPVIAKVVENATMAALDRRIALRPRFEHVPLALADAERVEQIASNLLSNAIKFTPAGGSIGVHLTASGSEVRLIMSDTGVGIDPQFLPHLFEPFSQTADGEAHDGLGLGLAIVKSLVEAQSGTVSAQSSGRGTGSTFVVTLPVSHADADVAAL